MGKRKFILFAIVLMLPAVVLWSQPAVDGFPWNVYMKVEPCVDSRMDWMQVADQQPAFGLNHFIIPQGATRQPTMAAALELADFLSLLSVSGESTMFAKFDNYCCHDWTLWKDNMTGVFTTTKGPVPPPGGNFAVEDGNLCCETARIRGDLPGGCRDYILADGVTRVTATSTGFVSATPTPVIVPSPSPSLPPLVFLMPFSDDPGTNQPPIVVKKPTRPNPPKQPDDPGIEVEINPNDDDGAIFDDPTDNGGTTVDNPNGPEIPNPPQPPQPPQPPPPPPPTNEVDLSGSWRGHDDNHEYSMVLKFWKAREWLGTWTIKSINPPGENSWDVHVQILPDGTGHMVEGGFDYDITYTTNQILGGPNNVTLTR